MLVLLVQSMVKLVPKNEICDGNSPNADTELTKPSGYSVLLLALTAIVSINLSSALNYPFLVYIVYALLINNFIR